MLDIILLVVLAILIARLIWRLFGTFQHLFAYLRSLSFRFNATPQGDLASNEKPLDTSKMKENLDKLNKNDERVKNQIQISEGRIFELQGIKVNSCQKGQQKKQKQDQQARKEKTHTKNKQQFEYLLPTQFQAAHSIEQSKTLQYQFIINNLKEQIGLYQRQKQLYIQRIQQIIQHVVNETQIEEQSRNSTEDDQLSAINSLRHQLIAAHHKIHQQQHILTKKFEKEKESLINDYEQRIQSLQADMKNKTSLYQATINEVYLKIQERERNGYYLDDISEQKIQEEQRQKTKKEYQQLFPLFDLEQQNKFIEKLKFQSKIQSLTQELQKRKYELNSINQELVKNQGILIQHQVNYESQIQSLKNLNKQLSENLTKAHHKLSKVQLEKEEVRSTQQNQAIKRQQFRKELTLLEQKLANEVKRREQAENKLQYTHEQLKFCQQQLKNLRDSESELKKAAYDSQTVKKTDRPVKNEDNSSSPQYLRMKIQNQRLKRKTEEKQEEKGRQSSGQKQREFSPCFPSEVPTAIKQLPTSPGQTKKSSTTSPYSRPISAKSPSRVAASTIFAGQQRSLNQKTVACSMINQGGIIGETYLAQTDILNQAQRNFIINEVSAVKKITVKKTRIMYSQKQKNNKSIHQYVLGAPNIILIAQLQNGKIVGAFTQNAFSRENKFTKSSIVSKAMIFDATKQVYITNQAKGQIIRCEESLLIWGNYEFVVHCQESLKISVNLNCEQGVYPSNYSSEQFIGSSQKVMKVAKIQVHRVFLG